jgi:hypothetical protein
MTTSLLNKKDAYFYKIYSRPHSISRHCTGTSVALTSQPKMPDVISDYRKSELSLFAILHKLHEPKSLFRRQYLSECSRLTWCSRKFGSLWSNIHLRHSANDLKCYLFVISHIGSLVRNNRDPNSLQKTLVSGQYVKQSSVPYNTYYYYWAWGSVVVKALRY